VSDEHGGVALDDDRRESLETAPEVPEKHVLRVAWRDIKYCLVMGLFNTLTPLSMAKRIFKRTFT